MNQPNQETSSPLAADLLAKRKRGRPRKDDAVTQLENSPVTPKPVADSVNQSEDTDMVGQVVSGVVEGSFDEGYFLNVKIKDTDKQLRGVVFLPGKVAPITPANDVAPYAKMHGREDISIPSPAQQQTQPQGEKETNKQPETGATTLITDNKNQTESSMASLTHDHPMKDAITDSQLPPSNAAYETPMKDIGGLEIPNSTPESRALPLMPQASYEQFPEQHNAVVQAQEANADTSTDNDVVMEPTRLVEFFPTPETIQKEAMGTSLFQKEKDQQKSPRGFNLLTEKPAENVPEELQLELGNKTMSGDNITINTTTTTTANTTAITTEKNPQTTVSKSGFLANLFEGEATDATKEVGFSVKNVDCDKEVAEEEATPSVQ